MAAKTNCFHCGNWFVPTDPQNSVCPECREKNEAIKSVPPTQPQAQASESKEAAPIKLSEVKIVDFDMPFWSMTGFMLKWAFATIPALIVLFVVGMILGAVFNISLVRLFR